ncbi:MAG: DNA-binding protein [Alphaproteobacteria bacterium]|nr:DNA-binding protein [Alphaproteobacteria bacterium]
MTFEQLCELFNYTPKGKALRRKEAADVLGLSVATLEGYAGRGVGPRYFMPRGTRRVWYAERDLLVWLASGLRRSTSDLPADLAAA